MADGKEETRTVSNRSRRRGKIKLGHEQRQEVDEEKRREQVRIRVRSRWRKGKKRREGEDTRVIGEEMGTLRKKQGPGRGRRRTCIRERVDAGTA